MYPNECITEHPDRPSNDDIEAVIQMATAASSSQQAPRDTRTQLFVGNLPYRVRWQDLKDLFRRAGTILRADVSLGPDNRSRGYGTVLFASADDAARAVDMFNNFSWQTRILEVRPDRLPLDIESSSPQPLASSSTSTPVPSASLSAPVQDDVDYQSLFALDQLSTAPCRNLFVGNLPFHCQWQDLKDLFRQAGTVMRADVVLGPDGRSRGFGTVVFGTEADAEQAVKMFHGHEYNGRTLKVHYDKYMQAEQPFSLLGHGYFPAGHVMTSDSSLLPAYGRNTGYPSSADVGPNVFSITRGGTLGTSESCIPSISGSFGIDVLSRLHGISPARYRSASPLRPLPVSPATFNATLGSVSSTYQSSSLTANQHLPESHSPLVKRDASFGYHPPRDASNRVNDQSISSTSRSPDPANMPASRSSRGLSVPQSWESLTSGPSRANHHGISSPLSHGQARTASSASHSPSPSYTNAMAPHSVSLRRKSIHSRTPYALPPQQQSQMHISLSSGQSFDAGHAATESEVETPYDIFHSQLRLAMKQRGMGNRDEGAKNLEQEKYPLKKEWIGKRVGDEPESTARFNYERKDGMQPTFVDAAGVDARQLGGIWDNDTVLQRDHRHWIPVDTEDHSGERTGTQYASSLDKAIYRTGELKLSDVSTLPSSSVSTPPKSPVSSFTDPRLIDRDHRTIYASAIAIPGNIKTEGAVVPPTDSSAKSDLKQFITSAATISSQPVANLNNDEIRQKSMEECEQLTTYSTSQSLQPSTSSQQLATQTIIQMSDKASLRLRTEVQSHPRHPGPIKIPPLAHPSFSVPAMSPTHYLSMSMMGMSPLHYHHPPGQTSGEYRDAQGGGTNVATYSYNQTVMTPHGLPPITPSMPPFTFLPSPLSPQAQGSQKGDSQSQGQITVGKIDSLHQSGVQTGQHFGMSVQQRPQPQHQQAFSSTAHYGYPSYINSQPSSPVHPMHHYSQLMSTLSPGVAMSPGALWGRPGEPNPNPFINPAVGAPVHGGFYYPMPSPGHEPKGYFDTIFYKGTMSSGLSHEIQHDEMKREEGRERELEVWGSVLRDHEEGSQMGAGWVAASGPVALGWNPGESSGPGTNGCEKKDDDDNSTCDDDQGGSPAGALEHATVADSPQEVER